MVLPFPATDDKRNPSIKRFVQQHACLITAYNGTRHRYLTYTVYVKLNITLFPDVNLCVECSSVAGIDETAYTTHQTRPDHTAAHNVNKNVNNNISASL